MIHGYWGVIESVDDSVGIFAEAAGRHRISLRTPSLSSWETTVLLNGENGMVDKRAMHDASIRIPLIVRYPGLTPTDKPVNLKPQCLTLDVAPSLLELCHAEPLPNIQGKSWVKLVREGTKDWRKAWFYEYNYEKQFPYTPNVRGVRTDQWKYVHYPHGDGDADRHMAEL